MTTVVASDPDGTSPTYAIAGGADAARFAINATTGALSFVAGPEFRGPADAGGNNVYDVIVSASDGNLTDTQALGGHRGQRQRDASHHLQRRRRNGRDLR